MIKKVILNDVIRIISGGTPKTTIPEYWNGDIGWLSINDFNNDYRVVYNSEKTITQQGLEESSTKILEKGDLIISARGTVGVLAQIGKPMAFNQSCFGLRGLKGVIDNTYLYYALKNYVVNIQSRGQGSVFNTINLDSFKLMEIEIEGDLYEQKKIAFILSALDDKIELNNRINDNLEQMAKAVYDYWFMQFDFPDKNGRPYKSSGGKMVWNEVVKRDIPADWDVGVLHRLLSLEYGKPLKQEDRSNSGYPVYGSNGVVGYHEEFLSRGPGIVVGRKGSAGEVIRTSENFYPIDTTYYVLDEIGMESLSFHYQFLLRCNLKAIESSSAVPGLNRNVAHSILSIIPPIKLIQQYSKFVDTLYHELDLNNKQNQELTKFRDWLLPILINGQVKID